MMMTHLIQLSKLSGNAISEDNILHSHFFFANYAQPILSPENDLHPSPESCPGVTFINMHTIFPNDRGQNRAFSTSISKVNSFLAGLNN